MAALTNPRFADAVGGQRMNNERKISQALAEFSEWAMPWAYLQDTLAAKELTQEERTLIKQIWNEACSSAYWTLSSMPSDIARATAGLKASFPWLSDGAILNLTRAASYQWN
ncbi:hypothetical protein [Herbaspirillum robiniae]|uniref:hypothetical protein n=1 Tax=Herbaspirillum robiniae TaxID=2014887 RepID=UPI00101ADB56|nr:hypothetical protein [Herbaspirillum robiniae]